MLLAHCIPRDPVLSGGLVRTFERRESARSEYFDNALSPLVQKAQTNELYGWHTYQPDQGLGFFFCALILEPLLDLWRNSVRTVPSRSLPRVRTPVAGLLVLLKRSYSSILFVIYRASIYYYFSTIRQAVRTVSNPDVGDYIIHGVHSTYPYLASPTPTSNPLQTSNCGRSNSHKKRIRK
jgi:hypothetical protein